MSLSLVAFASVALGRLRGGCRAWKPVAVALLASCSSDLPPTPSPGADGRSDASRGDDGTTLTDAAMVAEILATSPVSSWPTTIAVDATHVYWSAPTGVMKVPKAGGMPELVAATDTGGASAVAVDATSVFYAVNGTIRKVPLGGGDSTLLAPATTTNAIAVDARFIYWADNRGLIMRLLHESGQLERISSSVGYPSRLAIDANAVYWVDSTGVLSTKSGGDLATYLWEGSLFINSLIAVRGSEVFVTDMGAAGGVVFSLTVTGGTPRLLAAPQFPSGLAVDDENVYFADRERGTVEFVASSGGAAVPLASAQTGPDAIALDGAYVYWVNTGGSVARAHKP